ncbi:MAG: T9SS type A sorting domain-containing protein [Bacteroidota bacterium]|nr:T9SS type A sorting domain-containing protein [Bacteroidota bacterium]
MSILKYFKLFLFVSSILFLTSNLVYSQSGNGYANPCSVTNGDTIKFHISTSQPLFEIKISKLGATETLMGTYSNITGGVRAVPESSYTTGCKWPVSFSLVIPESWPSGAYAARFPLLNADSAGKSTILFFVKEKQPSTYSKLLIVLPYFTWVAENDFGGKNTYNETSSYGQRANRLSLNRPFFAGGYAQFRSWPLLLMNWFDSKGIKYEIATDLDVHNSPSLLKNYQTIIAVGHDEYYSRAQRTGIENYLNSGGKFINFSGNTCWWQIRMEENNNVLVCYKDPTLDPLSGIADSLVTVNWYKPPVNYPENLFLGASYRNGGYVNDIHHDIFTYGQGYGGYTVYNSQHWVYNNTGLKDGEVFGRDPIDSLSSIVGYITDGALFSWQNGIPKPLSTDGTPSDFRILGISPAVGEGGKIADHHATMGTYINSKGGTVFNASTVYWVNGLAKNPAVQTITMNVLDRFMNNTFPPEITRWSPFVVETDTINGEIVQVNKREIPVQSGDTTRFSVQVQNPAGEVLQYAWFVNDQLVGTDSVYTHIADTASATAVKVVVFNSKDSSSVSWMLKKNNPVGVRDHLVVKKYDLEQNYPNPFNPSTNIRYSLASESKVKITIYNGLGQVVAVLADKVQSAGNYSITWKASNLSSGIYFYSIEAGSTNGKDNFRSVKKMMLIK